MLSVPATMENARKIFRLGIKHRLNMDPALEQLLAEHSVPQQIDGFNFGLKAYQAEGVAWLESQLGSGLLADEQGTGKTVQVMAYAHKNQKFPMLVVCPNSLKLNWRNEIVAMTDRQYRINVVGRDYSLKQTQRRLEKHPNVIYSRQPTENCDIYIIHYDMVHIHADKLENLDIKLMVMDESHKLKSIDALRTKACIRLAAGEVINKTPGGRYQSTRVGSGIDSVIMLSGTPMINRPRELWTTVRTLASWVPQFWHWGTFAHRYCAPVHTGHGWNFSGASNTSELNSLLRRTIMLRRLKADVLDELPEKTYKTIPLDFNRLEYDLVEAAFDGMDWQAGMEAIIRMGGYAASSDETIVAVQKLREVAAYAKIDSAVQWIKDYTENGNKLVVFAHNRQAIDSVKAALDADPKYTGTTRVIYGGMDDEERADAVADFQNDHSVRVILVSMTAGGFGLTLHAASSVAFLQLPWTPGEISQCIDRVHRIGQTADAVSVYILVAEGTIEESIADMLISKGQVLDAVLDNGRKVNQLDLRG